MLFRCICVSVIFIYLQLLVCPQVRGTQSCSVRSSESLCIELFTHFCANWLQTCTDDHMQIIMKKKISGHHLGVLLTLVISTALDFNATLRIEPLSPNKLDLFPLFTDDLASCAYYHLCEGIFLTAIFVCFVSLLSLWMQCNWIQSCVLKYSFIYNAGLILTCTDYQTSFADTNKRADFVVYPPHKENKMSEMLCIKLTFVSNVLCYASLIFRIVLKPVF